MLTGLHTTYAQGSYEAERDFMEQKLGQAAFLRRKPASPLVTPLTLTLSLKGRGC